MADLCAQAGYLSFPAKGLSKLKPHFNPVQRQSYDETVAEGLDLRVETEEEEEPSVEPLESTQPGSNEDSEEELEV